MVTDTEQLRARLVGRADALAEVAAVLDPGGGAVVVGAGGIGKTALLEAAAADPAFYVVKIRGSRVAAKTPFGALAWLISDLPEGVAASPVRLLQELESRLVQRAQAKRILLLVDNAEHLDASTAMVLSQLVRRSGASVLAAAENLSAAAPEFLALWTEGLLHRIDLAPLTAKQTREQMGKILGGRVSSIAAQAMHRHSGGNPQLIRLLTQDQAHHGSLVRQGDFWGLAKPLVFSGPIAELITARLNRLPPAERSLVELLALSNELPLSVVLTLFPAEILDALEESRMVDTTGRVIRLASVGTAVAVAAAVPPGRSRELWELASPLIDPAALGPSGLDGFASWTLACQGTLDPETATRAARLSTASDDPESALKFIRAVPAHQRSQAMLLEEVQALRDSGDYPGALQALDGLADAADPGQPDTWMSLMMHKAALLQLIPGQGDPREVLERLDAAFPASGDQAANRLGEAALLLMRGALAVDAGRPAQVPDRLPAVAADQRLSRSLRLRATALQAQVLSLAGDGEKVVLLLPAFQEGFRSSFDPDSVDAARFRMFQALIACGEYTLAEQLVAELNDGGNRPAFRGTAGEAATGLIHALAGRQDSALSALASAGSQIQLRDPKDVLPLLQAGLAYVLALQGNLAEARAAAAAAAQYKYRPHEFLRLLSQLLRLEAQLAGDTGQLCGELRSLAERCLQQGIIPIALQCLAAAAVRHGDPEAARELAKTAVLGTGRWARALYCFGAGTEQGDPALLLESAELASGTGNVLLCNTAARAALRILEVRTDAGSRGQARNALRLEHASFRKLRDANTVDALMATLSPFEADLARRAAGPATRTEMSQALDLSPRTVDWHLGKIFDKLHVSGRSELAEVLR